MLEEIKKEVMRLLEEAGEVCCESSIKEIDASEKEYRDDNERVEPLLVIEPEKKRKKGH